PAGVGAGSIAPEPGVVMSGLNDDTGVEENRAKFKIRSARKPRLMRRPEQPVEARAASRRVWCARCSRVESCRLKLLVKGQPQTVQRSGVGLLTCGCNKQLRNRNYSACRRPCSSAVAAFLNLHHRVPVIGVCCGTRAPGRSA